MEFQDGRAAVAAGGGSTLTLVTCYPFYYVGSAPKRFIVRANQQESASTKTSAPVLVARRYPAAPTVLMAQRYPAAPTAASSSFAWYSWIFIAVSLEKT